MTPGTRQGSAAVVAEAIRTRIVAGELRPGEHLVEADVRADLGVSRSTLREGLRSLVQHRLVVHHMSRGFFVRELDVADVQDLYAVRHTIECGALRIGNAPSAKNLKRLSTAVAMGERATRARSWQAAAAASIAFHAAIVDLADSPRLSEINRRTLAEFRLSYAFMDDPLDFHVPFIARHQEIAEKAQSGDLERAAVLLGGYLDDSENVLLARIGEHHAPRSP